MPDNAKHPGPERAPSAAGPEPAQGSFVLSGDIRHKYQRTGADFYRKDAPERPAFSLQGSSGIRIHDSQSVADAIAIARDNGWKSVRVRGSKAFRQAVYQEARRAHLEVAGIRQQNANAREDPDAAREAAARFRRNSHKMNAATPMFRAAQSVVLAAALQARTLYPNPADRERYVARAKEAVAKQIEAGATIKAARFEQQRTVTANRLSREFLLLHEKVRTPSRSR